MLLQNVNTTTCSVSSTAQEINQTNETASVNMKGRRQTIDVNFIQSDFLKFIGSIMCDFFKGKRGRRNFFRLCENKLQDNTECIVCINCLFYNINNYRLT